MVNPIIFSIVVLILVLCHMTVFTVGVRTNTQEDNLFDSLSDSNSYWGWRGGGWGGGWRHSYYRPSYHRPTYHRPAVHHRPVYHRPAVYHRPSVHRAPHRPSIQYRAPHRSASSIQHNRPIPRANIAPVKRSTGKSLRVKSSNYRQRNKTNNKNLGKSQTNKKTRGKNGKNKKNKKARGKNGKKDKNDKKNKYEKKNKNDKNDKKDQKLEQPSGGEQHGSENGGADSGSNGSGENSNQPDQQPSSQEGNTQQTQSQDSEQTQSSTDSTPSSKNPKAQEGETTSSSTNTDPIPTQHTSEEEKVGIVAIKPELSITMKGNEADQKKVEIKYPNYIPEYGTYFVPNKANVIQQKQMVSGATLKQLIIKDRIEYLSKLLSQLIAELKAIKKSKQSI